MTKLRYFIVFFTEDKDGDQNSSSGKDGELLLTNVVEKLENEVYQNMEEGEAQQDGTSDEEDWVSVDSSEDDEEEDAQEEVDIEEDEDDEEEENDQIGKTGLICHSSL